MPRYYRYMKSRLLADGGVANHGVTYGDTYGDTYDDTYGDRCGLRLALDQNPSISFCTGNSGAPR